MMIGAILLLFALEKDQEYQREIYLSFINLGIGAGVVAINVTLVILIPHNPLVNVILIMTLLGNLVSALAPLTAYGFRQPVPIYVIAGVSGIGIILPCFMSFSNSEEFERRPSEASERPSSAGLDHQTPEIIAMSIEQ